MSRSDTRSRADIADPATYAGGVPHADFARRRAEEPVAWVPEPLLWRHSSTGRMAHQGSGYWAVTRHADVLDVSRRTEDFSSGLKGAFLTDPKTRADLVSARQLLINMDAPEHLRIRRIVTSAFTPRAVQRIVDDIGRHAEAVVGRVVAAGEFDAVEDLAAELPLLVLADMLGIPHADRHLLYRWSNQLVGFDDPEYGGGDVDAYRRTFVEAFQYALGLAADRRENPRDDLITRLVTAEVDDRRLTDREFCNFWLLLVVAGNETTRHLIAGTVQALTDRPDERERLLAGDVGLPSAVDELIRWVTPIMQFRRTARHDTELAGQPIAAGDKVAIYYTSANRDAAVFADPDRLDLGRTPNPHLSFGIGQHFCLGAHLARAELTAMLTALRPHLRGLEITGPVTRLTSNFVNGAKTIPARIRR